MSSGPSSRLYWLRGYYNSTSRPVGKLRAHVRLAYCRPNSTTLCIHQYPFRYEPWSREHEALCEEQQQ
eukprot:scaffold2783_cov129-Cylindrotheca_fusiformis.AAC.13